MLLKECRIIFDWLEMSSALDRIKVNENTVHYSFDAPDEEDEA